jgi:hypothetical protein
MPVLRLQVSFGADTAFPRDRLVITPHFNVGFALPEPNDLNPSPDAQALCNDLGDALQTWSGQVRELTVKAYDAQGSVPVFPIGSTVRGLGAFPASNGPREIALCLSYYSGRNIPRYRGRLYIPMVVALQGAGSPRPTPANQTKVAALAPIFANLGGTNVDWVVYSRLDDTARPVSNWYVDDEWDNVRSRGFRSTARLTGTLNE